MQTKSKDSLKNLLNDAEARIEYFRKKINEGSFFSSPIYLHYVISEQTGIKHSKKSGEVSIVDLPMLTVMAFARNQKQRDIKNQDGSINEAPRTVCFYGGMGLGKTTMIEKELPKFYKNITGQDIYIKHIGMKGLETTDIVGVPTIVDKTNEKGEVVDRKAILVKIRDLLPTEKEVGGSPTILFFDEINLSNISVLEMMRELFNTGEMKEWGYKLPKNSRIIMAGNIPGEVSNLFVNETPAALTNRILSYYVALPKTKDELEAYLSNIGFHPLVYGYLKEGITITVGKDEFSKLYCPQVMETSLNVVSENATYTGQAWPSPRSWEEVSRFIIEIEEMANELNEKPNYSSLAFIKGIEGAIGHIHTKDFMSFIKYHIYLVSPSVFFGDYKNDDEFNHHCGKLIINHTGGTLDKKKIPEEASKYCINLMWAQYSYLLTYLKQEIKTILTEASQSNNISSKDVDRIKLLITRFINNYSKRLLHGELSSLANANIFFTIHKMELFLNNKLSTLRNSKEVKELITFLNNAKQECLKENSNLQEINIQIEQIKIGGNTNDVK